MKNKEHMYPIIEEYQQGSCSPGEVCAKYNISLNQLYYWQGKYNKEHQSPPGFIEIKPHTPKIDCLNDIQISYPSGVSIRIEKNVPLDLLRELIKIS